MNKILITAVILLYILSCTTQKPMQQAAIMGDYDAALADTVLAYALDHEALYTLADTLKPISSVKLLRYQVAKDSTMKDGDAAIVVQDSLLKKIEVYQKVCKALSHDDWEFLMVPFRYTEKNTRNIELLVVRKSRFAATMNTYAAFFGQWGFTASTNPAVVLTAIENESKLDRFRAYGYLFGYPPHAVDFFVKASVAQDADTAKKLVPRDFFAIPVFTSEKGYFTYAVPKGYQPVAVDSAIHKKAVNTLEKYKQTREKYNAPKGLQAMKLWRAINTTQ